MELFWNVNNAASIVQNDLGLKKDSIESLKNGLFSILEDFLPRVGDKNWGIGPKRKINRLVNR